MQTTAPRGVDLTLKKGSAMKSSSLVSAAALAGISALLLAGCATGGGEEGDGGEAATRACVILPDAAS
jgi:D-xylose transport system substrate-binding protein